MRRAALVLWVLPTITGCSLPTQRPAVANARVLDVGELSTEQIQSLDRRRTVVLLEGGILEEHGPYLPSFSDGYQSEYVAKKVANAIAARHDRQIEKREADWLMAPGRRHAPVP